MLILRSAEHDAARTERAECPASIEVEITAARYDACNGKGFSPVQEPEPGRRIYPAPCRKCGGKGRLLTKSE